MHFCFYLYLYIFKCKCKSLKHIVAVAASVLPKNRRISTAHYARARTYIIDYSISISISQ
jgi:hypothetical protein